MNQGGQFYKKFFTTFTKTYFTLYNYFTYVNESFSIASLYPLSIYNKTNEMKQLSKDVLHMFAEQIPISTVYDKL